MLKFWRSLSLIDRIRWLRYILPAVLIPIVVVYQLQIAFRLEREFGHLVHYTAEIAFYSLVGPVLTWFTLIWIERKLMEKESLEREVRAQTQQLASLTAASQDAILSHDNAGRITSWNKGAERLFGYLEEEITGQQLDELLPELEDHLEEREFQQLETTAQTKEGQKITVAGTLSRLEGAGEGTPVGLLIMRDITAQRERASILEEERARIARDLHDGVAQTLYFLALKADVTRQQVGSEPDQAQSNLQVIGKEARGAIQDVRRAILGLNPLNWSEGEFIPVLKDFIAEFAEQVGFQVDVRIHDEDLDIPVRLQPIVFRLIQESLNNIAKHAQAERVDLEILKMDGSDPGHLRLIVRDDGVGFQPDQAKRGMGISQMQKRVASIGGSFKLDSQSGKGTKIYVEIPLIGESNGRNSNLTG